MRNSRTPDPVLLLGKACGGVSYALGCVCDDAQVTGTVKSTKLFRTVPIQTIFLPEHHLLAYTATDSAKTL